MPLQRVRKVSLQVKGPAAETEYGETPERLRELEKGWRSRRRVVFADMTTATATATPSRTGLPG